MITPRCLVNTIEGLGHILYNHIIYVRVENLFLKDAEEVDE